jgi:hypothetical protein
MRFVIIGGSDAGISAALRARELEAKRIDVCATALFYGMKVEYINELNLSYTPPLGRPWDAVQMAAEDWSRAALMTTSEAEAYG